MVKQYVCAGGGGGVYPNVSESDVKVCINKGTATCLKLCLSIPEIYC